MRSPTDARCRIVASGDGCSSRAGLSCYGCKVQVREVPARSRTMPVYRRGDHWRYRKWVGLPDGRRIRIAGTPPINTKQAAEAAERAHIERLWNLKQPEKKEVPVPKFREFVEQFLSVA